MSTPNTSASGDSSQSAGGGGGSYTQADRPLILHTPLGADKLLLIGMTGQEAISQLFSFQMETLAEMKNSISFEKLLGQKVTACVQLPNLSYRFFNGIVTRVTEGGRDDTFKSYSLEMAPQFWLLTRRTQSRIFQQMTVPDILKAVLKDLNVSYKIQGLFEPRDYCVQYRETDFNFASRLMEEEGIFYYFEHSDGDHQMVVANTPASHFALANGSTIIYEGAQGGVRDDDRILTWNKTQELRSRKTTLWDHTFELPHKHLEAATTIQSSVEAGTVTHNLQAGNGPLELYDFPGHYAQRFDGVDPGGGDRTSDLQKIFADNTRTVGIRMQEEAFPAIVIQGRSDCRQMNSGHKFTLARHPDADGDYVLHSVRHGATLNAYRTNESYFTYGNFFSAFPFGLPFRPARVTPKPTVHGAQTAVVVGPPGQEIFTDKYGRVKVQFHWDRQGKDDNNSSCWVRVLQPTAGNRWGSSFWPRIGQEVVVDFEHGDPDTPIIVGAVYNATQMPPYLGDGPDPKHKNDNKVSGFKTCSTMGGNGYNELRFDDTKGKEEIFIHAERNMDERVKNDSMETIGNDRHLNIGGEKDGKKSGDQREQIYQDKSLKIHRNHNEWVGGNMLLHVGGIDGGPGNLDVKLEGIHKMHIVKEDHLHVESDRSQAIDGSTSLTVGTSQNEKIGTNHLLEAGQEIHFKAGMKVVIEAGVQLSLKVGGNFIDINPSGISISGTMILINSGGAAGSGTPSNPVSPDDADEAAPVAPVLADDSVTGNVSTSG